MTSTLARWMIVASLAAPAATGQEANRPPDTPARSLRIEEPIVCRTIDGFENYEPLPNAEQTSDEKLLVYLRPRDYAIVRKGDEFAAHFTQDGQIRSAGKKKVLRHKDNILDYEAVSRQPPRNVYLTNHVSLKGLPPGEYEYDVILRDEHGDKTPVTASVKFRIVAAKLPKPQD